MFCYFYVEIHLYYYSTIFNYSNYKLPKTEIYIKDVENRIVNFQSSAIFLRNKYLICLTSVVIS